MITDNFKRERYNGRTKFILKKGTEWLFLRFLLFPLTSFLIFYLDFIPQTLTGSGKPWYLMNQVETEPQGTGISSIFVNTVKGKVFYEWRDFFLPWNVKWLVLFHVLHDFVCR